MEPTGGGNANALSLPSRAHAWPLVAVSTGHSPFRATLGQMAGKNRKGFVEIFFLCFASNHHDQGATQDSQEHMSRLYPPSVSSGTYRSDLQRTLCVAQRYSSVRRGDCSPSPGT